MCQRGADRFAVLIEERRRSDRARTRAVELECRPHGLRRRMRCLDWHDDSEMLHLRITHDLVDSVDGRVWHVLRPQALCPVCERFASEARIELVPQALVLGNAPVA